ncbi:hypothetical protein SAMN05421504_113164 [Amycolatopsis xylanica]|uniref:Uncharacterized protein n=1 Tax=Amycolatopsis xylanica TaxID=589385 RepID=A0A1H3SF27_9PSEU|nr:hypothetical protein SAMN05421504_113164 [Amycolatopsis xylanica]
MVKSIYQAPEAIELGTFAAKTGFYWQGRYEIYWFLLSLT